MEMRGKYRIFSVEDDPIYRRLIQHRISMNEEIDIESFENAKTLLSNTYKSPHVLILDINLPDLGGIEIIEHFQKNVPHCLIIAVTSQEKIEVAVEILKSGVYDYISKDEFALDRLWISVHNALKTFESSNQIVGQIEHPTPIKYSFSNQIKGSSDEIKSLFRVLEKTITNNIPVEIYGETGTGKELVAKAIHFNSPKKNKPFVALNVAAFPKELVESELFGYEKGAFTRALQVKTGKLEEANGGTLFLDEISEMDLSMQAKLLRAIQEMEVSRLGSNKNVKLNFRIIIATHKNLLKEVREGRFREDLYYRLLGLKIEIPPLRKRGNDILILANYFIETYAKANKLFKKEITEDAKSVLLKYRFPGNVRELKAIVETAFVMSDSNQIDSQDLQITQGLFLEDLLSKSMTLEEYDVKIIAHYLKKNKYNVLKTAKELNIGKTTIYRFIKEGKIVTKKIHE